MLCRIFCVNNACYLRVCIGETQYGPRNVLSTFISSNSTNSVNGRCLGLQYMLRFLLKVMFKSFLCYYKPVNSKRLSPESLRFPWTLLCCTDTNWNSWYVNSFHYTKNACYQYPWRLWRTDSKEEEPIPRPVTSLGHQEGREFSERGPNFLNYVQ